MRLTSARLSALFSAVLLGSLLCAAPAQGEVFKCLTPDGQTQISNLPCADGSQTVKRLPDDVVPDDVREQAERDAEREQQRADQLSAERRAREEAERKEAERQQEAARRAAPPEKIYVPQPYYVVPGYAPPHRPAKPRPPNPPSEGTGQPRPPSGNRPKLHPAYRPPTDYPSR